MWQACSQIPQSLSGQEDVILLAAKLSVTFFLETFIHAKEKPTMVQWVELLTKQLVGSQTAAAWLLDHMAEDDWWPIQILLKCPNQMVRQMFQRLCIHVIQQLRPRHVHLYLKLPEGQTSDHPNDMNLMEFGSYSCVTRFIKRLLLLVSIALIFFECSVNVKLNCSLFGILDHLDGAWCKISFEAFDRIFYIPARF